MHSALRMSTQKSERRHGDGDGERAAVKGKWRVPEATLMLVGLFGGATAMLVTMKVIRHKTKHMKFMVGLPLEIALQAALLCLWVWLRLH